MRIRQFEREDLPSVLAIQNKVTGAARWQGSDYLRLASEPGGMILVAEIGTLIPPKVLGFAAFQRMVDEAELRNMAVDPEHQRQGVGKGLIREARKALMQAGTKRLFLEVRKSNQAALELYYSAGFTLLSERKEYYRDPPEDANILSLDL
jgi:ribosomal-protein-alanine N-acetyltransferase